MQKLVYEDELVRHIKIFTLVNYIVKIDFPSSVLNVSQIIACSSAVCEMAPELSIKALLPQLAIYVAFELTRNEKKIYSRHHASPGHFLCGSMIKFECSISLIDPN